MAMVWGALFCTAIALDMKKGAVLSDSQAMGRQGNAGMREDSGAKKAKAQGVCGKDVLVCPSGAEVYRDPSVSCRYLPCDETSLIEQAASPTFHWKGASISDEQSFCSRMTSVLGDYKDQSTTDCGVYKGPYDCDDHYVHVLDGNVGDIEHCTWDGGVCKTGAIHNCTWSFYMEDLITKHRDTEDNCAARLLETKRSLDGLLHSVQDIYNQLMAWNAIVQAENTTIRDLLMEQQDAWTLYADTQRQCDEASKGSASLDELLAEINDLRAIGNPDVRSAVDLHRSSGYKSSGETSESCPAAFPFVSVVKTAGVKQHCCVEEKDALDVTADPGSSSTCTKRECKSHAELQQGLGEELVDCVNNYRETTIDGKKYNEGVLDPSRSAAEAASFVELGSRSQSRACVYFQKLHQRIQRKLGNKLSPPLDCNGERDHLQSEFERLFNELTVEYENTVSTVVIGRVKCMNDATYEYKSGVEGLDGIDDQIQNAAGKIHEAQGEIARLEPMLHDVERATGRMRAYTETVANECGEEGYLGVLYGQIRKKIIELQECPGRNDFIIDVGHWHVSKSPTPSPTPWYERLTQEQRDALSDD